MKTCNILGLANTLGQSEYLTVARSPGAGSMKARLQSRAHTRFCGPAVPSPPPVPFPGVDVDAPSVAPFAFMTLILFFRWQWYNRHLTTGLIKSPQPSCSGSNSLHTLSIALSLSIELNWFQVISGASDA